MLGDTAAVATIGVRDMKRAARFYEDTLGLRRVGSMGDMAATYQSGNSSLFVYQSEYAGTNRATAVTWDLGTDVNRVVDDLKSKGVAFEHYDLPDAKLEGDIHAGGGRRLAWLKDPDGNILALAGR